LTKDIETGDLKPKEEVPNRFGKEGQEYLTNMNWEGLGDYRVSGETNDSWIIDYDGT
jgi:hypothetical protein